MFRGEGVLVLREALGSHITPGGRREVGETLEETLYREVLEETGWTLERPSLLGFLHFHHLGPEPPGYRYPYPDFVQVIYHAQAREFRPEVKLVGDCGLEVVFRPASEARFLDLSPIERFFLDAAARARADA